MGKHVGVATILPAPGSTDGYTTLVNQTADANAARLTWNIEARDGTTVASSNDTLAMMGASSSKGSITIIDPCKGFEVNAAGALTNNGGFVATPSVFIDLTVDDNAGALTRSTTAIPVFNSFTIWNQHRGKVVYVASVADPKFSSIFDNGTTSVQPLHTLELPSALVGIPANGVAIRIYQGSMHDTTHPATAGHTAAASGITNFSAFISAR